MNASTLDCITCAVIDNMLPNCVAKGALRKARTASEVLRRRHLRQDQQEHNQSCTLHKRVNMLLPCDTTSFYFLQNKGKHSTARRNKVQGLVRWGYLVLLEEFDYVSGPH